MKISRTRIKEIVKEVLVEENEYQQFFQAILQKHGGSISKMGEQEKKDFFNKVDAAWKSRGEKSGTEKTEVFEAQGNDDQMSKLHSVLNDKNFMSKASESDFTSKVNKLTNNYFGSGVKNSMLKKIYQDYTKNPKGWKYNDSTYRLEESNGLEIKKLKDAIEFFQDRIDKQGRVTNARDEEHLKQLKAIYKQMGGKGITESKIGKTPKKKINESTTERDNEEIIEFLLKNQKQLEGIPLTIFGRKKIKFIKSLVRELMNITKNGDVALKIGLSDKNRKIVSYTQRTREDMEKFMSGGIDGINIEYTNVPQRKKAIDQFGTSS